MSCLGVLAVVPGGPVRAASGPVRRIKPRPIGRSLWRSGRGPRAQAVCGGPSSSIVAATRLPAVAPL